MSMLRRIQAFCAAVLLAGCGGAQMAPGLSGATGQANSGQKKAPHAATVVATPAGPINITNSGNGSAATVTITEASYTGTFSNGPCAGGAATIATISNALGTATFAIMGAASGSCTVKFSDTNNNSVNVAINVGVPGAIVTTGFPLTVAKGSSKNVTVKQSVAAPYDGPSGGLYVGPFVERDSCTGVATIGALSSVGNVFTYKVTGTGAGICKVSFGGAGTAVVTNAVTVTGAGAAGSVVIKGTGVAGGVGSAPYTITLSNGLGSSITLTQTGYTGTFSSDIATGPCNGKITAIQTSLAAYTLYNATSSATTCLLTFTGGTSKTKGLNITADAAPGTVTLANVANPDTFTAVGSGAAQMVNVSEANYKGTFTELDDCTGTATVGKAVKGVGNSYNYIVTPVAAGSCAISFRGGSAGAGAPPQMGVQGVLVVPANSVVAAATVAQPQPLVFTNTNNAMATLTVTGPGATPASIYGESDTCSGIATILNTTLGSSSGSSGATYTVTPTAGSYGICQIVFSAQGKSFTVHVSNSANGIGAFLKRAR